MTLRRVLFGALDAVWCLVAVAAFRTGHDLYGVLSVLMAIFWAVALINGRIGPAKS